MPGGRNSISCGPEAWMTGKGDAWRFHTPANGKATPSQETGGLGAGRELMLQMLPAEGIPGPLWVKISYLPFCFLSFLGPFYLG